MNTLFQLISEHSAEIGTFLFTALVAAAKRWYDKRTMKNEFLSKGYNPEDVKKIIK